MKRYGFLALTAIALGTVGCERSPDQSQTDTGAPTTAQAVPQSGLPTVPSAQGASQPRISTNFSGNFSGTAAGVSAKKAEPSDTLASGLQKGIGSGRSNPFSSVGQPEVKVTYGVNKAASTTLPVIPQVTAVRIPAIASVITPAINPGLQAVPGPVTSPIATSAPAVAAAVPAVPMVAIASPNTTSGNTTASNPITAVAAPIAAPVAAPVAAPMSPTAIAEAIEIKGLVQVGGQVNLIIRDPDASTSRTVRVGDVIGGGKVKVTRINGADSQSPQVVLEQDGVEILRAIGA